MGSFKLVYQRMQHRLFDEDSFVGPIFIYANGFFPLLARAAAQWRLSVDWAAAVEARHGNMDLLYVFFACAMSADQLPREAEGEVISKGDFGDCWIAAPRAPHFVHSR